MREYTQLTEEDRIEIYTVMLVVIGVFLMISFEMSNNKIYRQFS